METARHKITESAVIKGKDLQEEIALLKANLMNASESVALQSDSPGVEQRFIDHLTQQLPTQIQCVQLHNLQTKEKDATASRLATPTSTCNNQLQQTPPTNFWPEQQTQLPLDGSKIYVTVPILQEATTTAFKGRSPLYNPLKEEEGGSIAKGGSAKQNNSSNQLELLLSAPIYNSDGQLRSILTIQARPLQQELAQWTAISGYTVVIDQEGIILSHPDSSQVGNPLQQEIDGEQPISHLLNKAIAGPPGPEHLFSLEENRRQSILQWFRHVLTKVIDGRLNSQELFSRKN